MQVRLCVLLCWEAMAQGPLGADIGEAQKKHFLYFLLLSGAWHLAYQLISIM